MSAPSSPIASPAPSAFGVQQPLASTGTVDKTVTPSANGQAKKEQPPEKSETAGPSFADYVSFLKTSGARMRPWRDGLGQPVEDNPFGPREAPCMFVDESKKFTYGSTNVMRFTTTIDLGKLPSGAKRIDLPQPTLVNDIDWSAGLCRYPAGNVSAAVKKVTIMRAEVYATDLDSDRAVGAAVGDVNHVVPTPALESVLMAIGPKMGTAVTTKQGDAKTAKIDSAAAKSSSSSGSTTSSNNGIPSELQDVKHQQQPAPQIAKTATVPVLPYNPLWIQQITSLGSKIGCNICRLVTGQKVTILPMFRGYEQCARDGMDHAIIAGLLYDVPMSELAAQVDRATSSVKWNPASAANRVFFKALIFHVFARKLPAADESGLNIQLNSHLFDAILAAIDHATESVKIDLQILDGIMHMVASNGIDAAKTGVDSSTLSLWLFCDRPVDRLTAKIDLYLMPHGARIRAAKCANDFL
jgi:hypothetical protein